MEQLQMLQTQFIKRAGSKKNAANNKTVGRYLLLPTKMRVSYCNKTPYNFNYTPRKRNLLAAWQQPQNFPPRGHMVNATEIEYSSTRSVSNYDT